MKNLIFSCGLLLLSIISFAQKVHYFTTGLGIGPVHQYGREAIYKDKLAYLLYNDSLIKPKEGGSLSTGLSELKWKPVQSDTSHRFRGDSFSNGYVYLTYDSKKEQSAILNVTGNDMVFVNGTPRGGDVYRYGWMNLPLKLKKGRNEFYVRVARFGRFGGITAKLTFPEKPVFLNTADITMPNAVVGLKNDSLWVGVVVVNASSAPLNGLSVKTDVGGRSIVTPLPVISAFSTRKVGVLVNAGSSVPPNKFPIKLNLFQNNKDLDSKLIEMETSEAGKQYSRTFISDIDGRRSILCCIALHW